MIFLSRWPAWQLTPKESERLNPPPLEIAEDEDGQIYYKAEDEARWLFVGYIPTPQTALGWFMYHLIHGLAMGYPIRKVIIFSMAHTRESEA